MNWEELKWSSSVVVSSWPSLGGIIAFSLLCVSACSPQQSGGQTYATNEAIYLQVPVPGTQGASPISLPSSLSLSLSICERERGGGVDTDCLCLRSPWLRITDGKTGSERTLAYTSPACHSDAACPVCYFTKKKNEAISQIQSWVLEKRKRVEKAYQQSYSLFLYPRHHSRVWFHHSHASDDEFDGSCCWLSHHTPVGLCCSQHV